MLGVLGAVAQEAQWYKRVKNKRSKPVSFHEFQTCAQSSDKKMWLKSIESMVMNQYGYVSHAVARFLESFTECASVSDVKDRYYT